MAAERKALRFQLDLLSTKDEALLMLLRLKQMLDSKTTEAEITSLSQQRKIEELDAQLNEAEEIITDLRLELKQVRDELEKVKNKKMPSDELAMRQVPDLAENPTLEDKMKTSKLIILPSEEDPVMETNTTSAKKRTPLNQNVLEGNCGNALSTSDEERYCVQESGFNSIVMRNKEPEPYRNGCTQRIRAIGGNWLDGNMHPSNDVENQNPCTRNGLMVTDTDTDEGKCTVSCAKIVETEKSSEVRKPVRARSVRRRRKRFGKDKATSFKSFEKTKMLQHSNSCYKSNLVKTVQKGKRTRVKCRNATFKSPRDRLAEPCQPSSSVSENAKSGEDQLKLTKTGPKMKSMHCLDPVLRSIKPDASFISGLMDVTISTGTLDDCSAGSAADNKGRKLIDESLSDKVEGDAAESLKVASLESKGELFDVPLMESDLKTTKFFNGSLSQTGNNRPLKYTFSRKRKKDSSNPDKPDQKTSPEKSSTKRRVLEKQTILPEPWKSSLLNESSRETVLVQVADQLISLSDKRWW